MLFLNSHFLLYCEMKAVYKCEPSVAKCLQLQGFMLLVGKGGEEGVAGGLVAEAPDSLTSWLTSHFPT